MGSVQRFSPSNDDFPRALGKVSFVGYFILLFFFVAFDVHIGDEPTRIDMASSGGAAVAALLWFGIGLLVEGSYRYWRGSFEARGIALGGAVAAGIGVLILLFVGKGGLLSWVGGGLALLVCIVLGAIQKGVTLTGAFGRLALLAAAYGLLAIIGPRNDVNHKPSPEAIQQARKAFSYEGSQVRNSQKKSKAPAARIDLEQPQRGKLPLPDEGIARRRSPGLRTLALAESFYRSGVRSEEDGSSKEAIADYKQAIACKPDYPDALNRLGLILTRTEQFNEAIAYFTKALALVPADATIHRNLGTALQMAGRTEEAEREFAKAEQLKHP